MHRELCQAYFLEISDLARCGISADNSTTRPRVHLRTDCRLAISQIWSQTGWPLCKLQSQLIRGEGSFRAYGLDHGGIPDVEHIQAQIKPAGRLAARGCAQSRHRAGRSLYRGVRCGLQRTTPSAGPYASGRQTKESRPAS